MAQLVMKMPGMQETQFQSLGQEEALEKGMATHSSIIAWRIPWAEEPGIARPRVAKSRTLSLHAL